MSDHERKHWLDDRRNVNKVIYSLYAICAFVGLLDLVSYKHHLHFRFEYWFGFASFYGFVACVILVIVAKYVLRPMVMRDEDYYDD